MSPDFTFRKYEELCSGLMEHEYSFLPVHAYLGKSISRNKKIAILRHDIDRKPFNALRIAKMESDWGIQATYYFRYPQTFNKPIIKEILDLGHEIGYHYEVLSKCNGDLERAIELFEYELNEFKRIADIKTICMHGSPLSKYDNRDLWKYYAFTSYGIIGEAFISINNVEYFSDSGRTWGSKNKIRDFMPKSNFTLNTTDGLIRLIKSESIKQIYILTHPERWASSKSEWIHYYLRDQLFNIGKKAFAGA